ncbi:MAG: DUF2812 domain-containing protein [Clostridiales bacterium]|nr:DUF2812 domain-containing protein [Clostridiales bacterium]
MEVFKMYLDIEKEERWLNEMSEKGYTLGSKFFRYKFEKIDVKNRVIRVDFRTFKTK